MLGILSSYTSAPPQPKPRAAAFSMDDSDDDDGGKAVNEIARVNAQLAKRRAADEAALAAASIDDPSIYDYDGEYDKFKSSEVKSHHLSQPSTSKEPPVSCPNDILDGTASTHQASCLFPRNHDMSVICYPPRRCVRKRRSESSRRSF